MRLDEDIERRNEHGQQMFNVSFPVCFVSYPKFQTHHPVPGGRRDELLQPWAPTAELRPFSHWPFGHIWLQGGCETSMCVTNSRFLIKGDQNASVIWICCFLNVLCTGMLSSKLSIHVT